MKWALEDWLPLCNFIFLDMNTDLLEYKTVQDTESRLIYKDWGEVQSCVFCNDRLFLKMFVSKTQPSMCEVIISPKFNLL